MKKLAAMVKTRKVKNAHRQEWRQFQHESDFKMLKEMPSAMSQSNSTFYETINDLQIFICRSYIN